jgi:DNA-binding CsgD family transcriptional regulator/tetratricopeptide (TPR) repeat protein
MGKSRLGRMARDEASHMGFLTAEAQGFRIDQGVPFGLWANACHPLVGGLDTDTLATLTRGSGGLLKWILPLPEDVPLPTDVDAAPGELTTRIHWSFLELLKGAGKKHPLFLLLDDVHWADTSSLDLLHFVARHAGELPLLVVCTCNSDLRAAGDEVTSVESELVQLEPTQTIDLRPISQEACQELLERRFEVSRPTAANFATRLFQKTGGNPFFVKEILGSLIDSGTLHERGGAWVGWDVEHLELPDTVTEIVAARTAELGDEAREVANAIAISDSGGSFEALGHVCGMEESQILDAIDELLARNMVEESADGGRIVYSFGHPLVREVLYQELGLARVRSLHRRTAEALEEMGTGSNHEIAYHFVRSGERSERAVRYLSAAGSEALSARANREAVAFLERALEVLNLSEQDPTEPGLEARREVEENLARALQRVGRYDDAQDLWQALLVRAVELGEDGRAAELLQHLGQGAFWQGRYLAAIAHYDAGIAKATAAADRAREGHLLLRKGIALQALSKADEAASHMDRALDAAHEVKDEGLEARVHRGLMILSTWMGRPDEAKSHGRAAIEIATGSGDLQVAFWVHWALSVQEGFLGNTVEMNEHMEHCQNLAERLHSPVLELWTAEVAIEHAAATGRWDDGIALGEQAVGLARRLGQKALLPRILVWLSLIYFGRGEIELGKECVDEAWEVSGAGGNGIPKVHMVLPAYIGRVAHLVTTGRYQEAIELGERGLEIAENSAFIIWAAHRLLPFVAEAYLQLRDAEGGLHIFERMRTHSDAVDSRLGKAWTEAFAAIRVWHSGGLEEAADLLLSAAESLEAIPMVFDAARLRRQRAGRLVDLGRTEEALSELRAVHETFRLMGAESELTKTRGMFREVDVRPPHKRQGSGAAGLTERELDIARLVADRKSNKAIARTLDVSPRTVSTHISNVFRKLDIGSRGELADFVKDRGLLG